MEDVILSPVGGVASQFLDNNGNPLSGGLLYTYQAGTTTPYATYTSAAGTTAHTNPIELNAAGRVQDSGEIWLANESSYKFVLKTAGDTTIATYDDIFVSTYAPEQVYVDNYPGIEEAIADLPAEGGVVVFSAKTYRSPYFDGNVMTRNNITFKGAGKPDFNSGYTALEGGTVIVGPFNWQADGCTFADLGIDSGSSVCASYFAGAGQEGLVTADAGQLHSNNSIVNVSVLGKDAFTPGHAILFESQSEGFINNISTVYLAAGLVIKGSRINVDGVYARSHRNYSVLAKSDAGGLCDSINYNNIIIDTVGDPSIMIPGDAANWDTNGFVLLPVSSGGTDYPVTNITASNFVLRNCVSGVELDTGAGLFVDAIKDVVITNVVTGNHYFAGITVGQGSKQVRFSDIVSRDSAYGVVNSGDDVIFSNVTSIGSGHDCFSNSVGVNVLYENCTAADPYSINFVGFENGSGQSIVRTPNYGQGITTNKTNNVSGTQTIEDISELNQQTSTVRRYLRRQFIEQVEAITGAGSIVAAYFGTDDLSATTMIDWSTYGTHVATFRDASLSPVSVTGATSLGMGTSVYYSDNNLWDTPDASDLSFGNGTTDSPFSVMSLCQPQASYVGEIAAKYDETTGSEKREWYFQLSASSGLFLNVTDNSTGGVLLRRDSNSLAPYDGVWTTFTGTYDGSSTSAGLKVYINDTETTNSDLSSGSYTAMEDTASKVGSYKVDASGVVQNGMTGNVACTLIFNVNLSAAAVISVRSLLTTYNDI